MAPYDSGVTEDDVRAEYDTNASTASVERGIRAAEATVSNVDTSEFTDQMLDDLVTYLACHYVAASDPTVESDEIGDSAHDYESATGEGLRETRFGRRALALDHTGGLTGSPGDEDEVGFETFG